jgi:maleate isomerase
MNDRTREDRQQKVPGWRGRIGILYPDDGVNDDEFWLYLPEGVSLLMTRYRPATSGQPIAPEMLAAYADIDTLTQAARTLTVTRPVSVAFCCNSCSFIGGPGSAERIRTRIAEETETEATTTTTAQLAAIKTLGVDRVAIGAPYTMTVTEKLTGVLEAEGVQVTNVKALGLTSEWAIGNSELATWYQLAQDVDTPETEAIVLACGGIRTAEIMDALEDDLGKPIISAPAVSIWHALRLAGIEDRVNGRGRLFREH